MTLELFIYPHSSCFFVRNSASLTTAQASAREPFRIQSEEDYPGSSTSHTPPSWQGPLPMNRLPPPLPRSAADAHVLAAYHEQHGRYDDRVARTQACLASHAPSLSGSRIFCSDYPPRLKLPPTSFGAIWRLPTEFDARKGHGHDFQVALGDNE